MTLVSYIKRRTRPRWVMRCVAAASIALTINPVTTASSQSPEADNLDAVKAAFLFNFAKFTKWPRISEFDTSIKFCVQKDALSPSVFSGWGKKRIQGRPVRVAFFEADVNPDVQDCSIMYIGDLASVDEFSELLVQARENSTLLVSNTDGFGERGGHIELYLANRRLRFKVNLDEMTSARLSLGAAVLNLAEIVDTEGDEQ